MFYPKLIFVDFIVKFFYFIEYIIGEYNVVVMDSKFCRYYNIVSVDGPVGNEYHFNYIHFFS